MLRDFLIFWGILKAHKTYDVAFLVHPRGVGDIVRKFPFLGVFPKGLILALMHLLPPVRVAPIRIQDKEVRGIIIAVPLTSRQMLNNRGLALNHIQRAVSLAEKFNVSAIGLGAMTASLSHGGTKLSPQKARITTGRLFTAMTVASMARRGVEALGYDPKNIRVGIVGAAGSIGSASAQLLARAGYTSFTLVDLSSNSSKLEEIVQTLKKIQPAVQVSCTESVDAITGHKLIITATSKDGALITDKHALPGVIVVDDAQPPDTEKSLCLEGDVLVLSGGAVEAPSVSVPFYMGMSDPNSIYSCMAEVLLLSLSPSIEGSNTGELREISFNAVLELEQSAKEAGFGEAPFQNEYRAYTEEDITHIRTLAKKTSLV